MGFKANDSVHKGLSNVEEQQWLRTCYDHYWKLLARWMTSCISKGEKSFKGLLNWNISTKIHLQFYK